MTGPGGRKRRVVIVGAGISGLMAARHLADGGCDVIVLDMAAVVGGRMATRQVGNLRFDHGAQFFHTTHPVFHRYVRQWQDEGVLKPWLPHPAPSSNGHAVYDPEAWYGVGGMTAIPEFLAKTLDVRLNERVARVDVRPGGWRVWTESANSYESDGLILTLPAPLSLTLIENIDDLPQEMITRVRTINYQPIYTTMLQLSGPSGINGTGAKRLQNEHVSWILDNTRKLNQDSESAVTIQATPEFSRRHVKDTSDEVLDQIMDVIRPHLASEPLTTVIHRWRYAWPVDPLDEPETTSIPAPLALAGDGFGGEHASGYMIEAAALSGLSAAASVYEMLASL